jgi:hypothetical protein
MKIGVSALTGSRRNFLLCLVAICVFLPWQLRQYPAFQPAFRIPLVHANPSHSSVLFTPAHPLVVSFRLPALLLNLLARVLREPVEGSAPALFGLTSIKSSTYVWSTALFLATHTVVFAVIAHGIGNLDFEGHLKNLRTESQIVGGVGLLVSSIGVWYYARGTMHSLEKDDPLST